MSGAFARRIARRGERVLLCAPWRSRRPVVFVTGLPRSGTTLLYQYLTHRLRVAYFTRGVGEHPGAAALVSALERWRHGAVRSDFTSRYGRIDAPGAPREAGSFWGRFFGLDDYRRYDDLSPEAVVAMRRSVAAVQWAFGNAPFVNKNVKHMLRIDALARVFPTSLFVVVERDPRDVALSVHRARHKLQADPAAWWSVRPPEFEALRALPVEEQVAGQLASLRARLDADLGALHPLRVVRVGYDELCRDPDAAIAPLRTRLGDVGFRHARVPSFAAVHSVPGSPAEQRLLELLPER